MSFFPFLNALPFDGLDAYGLQHTNDRCERGTRRKKFLVFQRLPALGTIDSAQFRGKSFQ